MKTLGVIPLPQAERISLNLFLSVMGLCSTISLMEGDRVDIGQKMCPSRRCSRFFPVVVRSSFVNMVSSSSVLRCCPSLVNAS